MTGTFAIIPIAGSFPSLPLLFFIVITVMVVAGMVVNFFAERNRTKAWQKLAEQSGFSFEAVNKEIHKHYPFRLMNRGIYRQSHNLLRGDAAGVSILLADYQYTLHRANSQTTYKQTICIAESESLNLPSFLIRPGGFFGRFGGIAGDEDFDFFEDPEFSNLYVLQGEDEEAVRGLFTPAVREFFVARIGDAPTVEGAGNSILLHFGKRVSPEESTRLLELAFELMKLWAG